MICLHVPIDYRNVSMVNFARGQKVVPAGWLLSADGPEISLDNFLSKEIHPLLGNVQHEFLLLFSDRTTKTDIVKWSLT